MRKATLISVATALVAVPTLAFGAGTSPSVTTDSPTAITDTSVTAHGTVDPGGQSTSYEFEYGASSRYGHQTTLTLVGSGVIAQHVSATIGGLTPGTTYHYRVFATGTGGTSTGTDQQLKTTGTAPTPKPSPAVTTGAASSINAGGAKASGTVNPNGLSTSYYFEFGTTSAYGFQTAPGSAGSGSLVKSVSSTLAGLAPNQTYHFRLVAVNTGGTTLGLDGQFKTNNSPPSASGLKQFGQTGFVSPSGAGAVLVGCIGQSSCQGSLTLSHGGVTLASRPSFGVSANNGGVVHFQLNATAEAELNRSHHLRVNVLLSQPGGQTTTGIITLVRFT